LPTIGTGRRAAAVAASTFPDALCRLWHRAEITHPAKTPKLLGSYNARFTEQIFVGDFFASFCKKGDSEKLSDATAC